MITTDWTVGDKTYKLRLTSSASVKLEQELGTNPINVLVEIKDKELPPLGTIIKILHASMTALNHGVSMIEVYAIYDQYIDEGHTIADIVTLLIDVFRVSGYIPDNDKNEKN